MSSVVYRNNYTEERHLDTIVLNQFLSFGLPVHFFSRFHSAFRQDNQVFEHRIERFFKSTKIATLIKSTARIFGIHSSCKFLRRGNDGKSSHDVFHKTIGKSNSV